MAYIGCAADNPIFTQINLSGLFYESSGDNLVATPGGGQVNALQLTKELNRITGIASSGDSIKLPLSAVGLTIIITNHGSNSCQVFGFGSDTIDDVAFATGVSQMANSMVIYSCYSAGQWYTEGLASGFVRGYSLQTTSPANIAANVTGTQASGTLILANQNTVSSAGVAYSVTLPTSTPGLAISIALTTATNTVAVFPAVGETINALGANASLVMGALTSTTFICTVAGQWYSTPRVPS